MMEEDHKEITFEEAIDQYGVLITKVCYYYSSDLEEFKDIRQEVLINLWKGWESFRKESKLSTWVYRISLNTCISYQRKENKNRKNRHIGIETLLNLPADEDTRLFERYKIMHELIGKLPFEDRAIILLWLDEKSYEEIATLIGINRNTLAVRLKRIKEKLKSMNR